MMRRRLYVQIVVAGLTAALLVTAREAGAHAKLRSATPSQGSQLDEPPSQITLSFTEAIEAPLSSVAIRNSAGDEFQSIHVRAVPGDRRSCVAPLEPLKPGSYVVEWRAVSADGHAMTGSYTFTVRRREPQPTAATPQPPAAAPVTPSPPPLRASRREMAARWLFIVGTATLLGAAAASVGVFGGAAELPLAAAGWVVTVLGLVLLVDAQRRTAGVPIGELLTTSIGRALLWRGAALAIAGLGLGVARNANARRLSMTIVAAAVLAAIAVHAAAGHAAAVDRFPVAAIGLQWIHFAAAGLWLGGLAALLIGTRGEPDPAKTAAVQRYSSLAGIALAVVAVTGILRTVEELSSWDQLLSTDYGQAALAKASLLVVIAAVGALNRWHSVPAASTNLRPLRQFALLELALMIVVLGVAAILATLSPPG